MKAAKQKSTGKATTNAATSEPDREIIVVPCFDHKPSEEELARVKAAIAERLEEIIAQKGEPVLTINHD